MSRIVQNKKLGITVWFGRLWIWKAFLPGANFLFIYYHYRSYSIFRSIYKYINCLFFLFIRYLCKRRALYMHANVAEGWDRSGPRVTLCHSPYFPFKGGLLTPFSQGQTSSELLVRCIVYSLCDIVYYTYRYTVYDVVEFLDDSNVTRFFLAWIWPTD